MLLLIKALLLFDPCLGDGLLEDVMDTSKFFLVLHTLHAVSDKGFFKVHLEQDQNSPFLKVISVVVESDFSFEPQQASHVKAWALFTKVHFLHVHFLSSGEESSPEEEFSYKESNLRRKLKCKPGSS